LQDDFKIAVYGNNFFGSVLGQLDRSGSINDFNDILLTAFVNNLPETVLPYEKLAKVASLLTDKFFSFYLKVTLSELVKYIARKLKYNKCTNTLSFRAQTVVRQIEASAGTGSGPAWATEYEEEIE
jgi:hypothetical protein